MHVKKAKTFYLEDKFTNNNNDTSKKVKINIAD